MGNYSKLIGSVVGVALSFAVTQFALPPEFASPEVVTAITAGITGILVWAFPANKPAA